MKTHEEALHELNVAYAEEMATMAAADRAYAEASTRHRAAIRAHEQAVRDYQDACNKARETYEEAARAARRREREEQA